MADNYLEKKFEEHLNAPYKPAHRKPSPLKTRRIVVTGGASGIGKFIVKALRVAAHKVAFCDTDDSAGRETALSTGADFFPLNVADAEALQNFLRQIEHKWGGIDAVVNVLPVKPMPDVLSTSPAQFDEAMASNVRPIIICAQEMARMRKDASATDASAYGRIVTVCPSVQAGDDIIAAAKGATLALTQSLAMSLAPWRITVNAISTGKIALPGEDHEPDAELPPAGREGRPDDVARVVRFLIDDASDFITAQNFTVDGGMTIKMALNK